MLPYVRLASRAVSAVSSPLPSKSDPLCFIRSELISASHAIADRTAFSLVALSTALRDTFPPFIVSLPSHYRPLSTAAAMRSQMASSGIVPEQTDESIIFL